MIRTNKMYRLILLVGLYLFLSQLRSLAQTSEYYEYVNHERAFGNYSNFLPISERSAYVIRNTALVKIEANQENILYNAEKNTVQTKFLKQGQDTVVFFFNHTTDYSFTRLTKIIIRKDSIQVLNPANRECDFCEYCPFYYNAKEIPCLDISASDFIIDSLDQVLMATTDAIYKLHDNLDTTRMASPLFENRIKFLKNQNNDIFYSDGSMIYGLDENYKSILLQSEEKFILEVEAEQEKMYLLFKDEIKVYDDQFENLLSSLDLNQDLGLVKDFTINKNGEIFIIQEDESNVSRTLRYNFDGTFDLLYEETLAFTNYNKVESFEDHILCIGQSKAVSIFKSQLSKFFEPPRGPDLRIDNVEITFDSIVRPDCNHLCVNYFYDFNCTVTSLGSDTVKNYNIAHFRYPLDFSFSFNSLKYNFGYDTQLLEGGVHTGSAEFNTEWKFGRMAFEIIGANNMLDRNLSNNVFEVGDIVAGLSRAQNSLHDVNLYPIPAQDELNIDASEPIHTVQLYNAQRVLIYALESQTNIQKIATKEFLSGIYFLQLWNKDKSKVSVQKLIIH